VGTSSAGEEDRGEEEKSELGSQEGDQRLWGSSNSRLGPVHLGRGRRERRVGVRRDPVPQEGREGDHDPADEGSEVKEGGWAVDGDHQTGPRGDDLGRAGRGVTSRGVFGSGRRRVEKTAHPVQSPSQAVGCDM
jgi:hypothetical protein